MATWVRWSPESFYRPCPECPAGAESVFWPARLAKRITSDDGDYELRRNDDCDHVLRHRAVFAAVGADDPRAEWMEIDWDPQPYSA